MSLRQRLSVAALILFIFSFYTLTNKSYGAEATALTTETITFSGGSRSISYVQVNLKDASIQLEAVVAGNQVGTTDSLKNIADQLKSEDKEVVAAINGTFFSAYDNNPLPYGTIQSNGEIIHIGNTGATIGFTDTNQVIMENLFVSITGTINENGIWYGWNINHPFELKDAVTIFTPEFGKETHNHAYTSIVVKDNRVTAIKVGKAEIPSDGFVIVTGHPTVIAKFKIGDAVKYKLSFGEVNYNNGNAFSGKDLNQNWKDVTTAIGAGPTLIRNGEITADGGAEGFFEDKILTNRGQRSFIGVTKDEKLLMGVVPNVTIKELAEICQTLGLYQAMNLDGGASSGLLYKDKLVYTPGRQLSNALVVTKTNKPQQQTEIKIRIDGEFIEADTKPVLLNGRTMIPFRTIFTALDAEVDWNEVEWSAIGIKGDTIIKLPIGEAYALVNNRRIALDVASLIIDGRSFVPVRFVAESLGARVEWDGDNSIVSIWTN